MRNNFYPHSAVRHGMRVPKLAKSSSCGLIRREDGARLEDGHGRGFLEE